MTAPFIIAHRGDSAHALENSLDAFRRALEVPADMVELDLRMTRDEGLFVLHDRRTGRTAERDADLERVSASVASAIRLKNGEPLPSLDDVLRLVSNRAAVNIEIKSDGAGTVLARRLQPLAPLRIVVSSFKEAEITAVRRAVPGVDCAVIYDTFSPRHIDEYRSRGYGLVSLRKNTVTETLVKACKSRGLRIFVWTVDSEDEMQRCIEWGVDGIYTNRPARLKELISRRQTAG